LEEQLLTDDAEDRPHRVDRHVGGRVRARRKILGRPQDALARSLGVSFQQVQKDERGANRIAASKLYEIAAALAVPVTFFFDGLDETGQGQAVNGARAAEVSAFLASADGQDWLQTVMAIRSPVLRRKVLDLARALAGEAD
jgi:transcriptional regulator with XRE-family HTH domain